MKRLQTGLAAAALAATGAFQADAAPIFLPKTVAVQSDVVQVRHRRYRSWYPAGAFVAGALIGGAVASSNRYYGDGYYRRAYYPDYYQRRVYYLPRGSAYRQGYRDGFRDGANARYYDDITCTQRLEDAGRC